MSIYVVVVYENRECMCISGTNKLIKIHLVNDKSRAEKISLEENGGEYTAEIFENVEDWTE